MPPVQEEQNLPMQEEIKVLIERYASCLGGVESSYLGRNYRLICDCNRRKLGVNMALISEELASIFCVLGSYKERPYC